MAAAAGRLTAVDGVSLSIAPRETVGLVGESGCGKSTFAHALVRLVPFEGRIRLDGEDVTDLPRPQLVRYRRRVQLVFQDPYPASTPGSACAALIAEPLKFARRAAGDADDRGERDARVNELLGSSASPPTPPTATRTSSPGGQRQRIGLAGALSVEPDVILADEPVSALDVSIQAQIINLLVDLQDRLDLTLVFIAHDLAVVRHVSDRVGVMYLGRIVEIGRADELYRRPLHPLHRGVARRRARARSRVAGLAHEDRAQRRPAQPDRRSDRLSVPPRCPIARPSRAPATIPPLVEVDPAASSPATSPASSPAPPPT